MTQQINLLNTAFHEQRVLLSFKGALLGWIGVAVLAVACTAYAQISVRTLAAQEREQSARVAAAREETQKLAGQVAARQRNPQIAAEIARLESQIRDRHKVMDVLKAGALGDTKGFSEHLRAFARQSFDGMWLTGLRIAGSGRDVTVEGRALKAEHVPGYLKRLNSERAMQGHPFSELVIQMPKPQPGEKEAVSPLYVEFRIATKTDDKTASAKETR